MTENYGLIQHLANTDVTTLKTKGESYGDSWRRRGGPGAFFMLSRKWDRIENICREHNYDIFGVGVYNFGEILDDIKDLRCYLFLVEAHVRELAERRYGEAEKQAIEEEAMGDPCPAYVNQDR